MCDADGEYRCPQLRRYSRKQLANCSLPFWVSFEDSVRRRSVWTGEINPGIFYKADLSRQTRNFCPAIARDENEVKAEGIQLTCGLRSNPAIAADIFSVASS